MLGWTQAELAERARIRPNVLNRLEHELVDSRRSTLESLQAVLETAGIHFLAPADGEGEGIRLRMPSERWIERSARLDKT